MNRWHLLQSRSVAMAFYSSSHACIHAGNLPGSSGFYLGARTWACQLFRKCIENVFCIRMRVFCRVLSRSKAHNHALEWPTTNSCAGICSSMERLHFELKFFQYFHLDFVDYFPQSHHRHLQQHLHGLRSGTCTTTAWESVCVCWMTVEIFACTTVLAWDSYPNWYFWSTRVFCALVYCCDQFRLAVLARACPSVHVRTQTTQVHPSRRNVHTDWG